MTAPVNNSNPQMTHMTFTPPKVGVVPTPPKTGGISKDTLEIANAKAPAELKNAGIKKKKGPINFINYLWLGVGIISSAVAGSEFLKLIKKH